MRKKRNEKKSSSNIVDINANQSEIRIEKLTNPISPLPRDSSVIRKISPPDRNATSPKAPPVVVSFSSMSCSPNHIKYI